MGSVTILIGRAKRGSRGAYDRLVGRFFPGQVRLARRRLPSGRVGIVEAEDVAAEAFSELWEVLGKANALAKYLSDTTTLLKVLARLTRQRVGKALYHHSRAKRNAWRAVQFHALAPGGDFGAAEPAADPWPSLHAALESRDVIEALIDVLPDPRHRELVRLWLDGTPKGDIADRFGHSPRWVERHFQVILGFWRSYPAARKVLGLD